MEHQHEHRLPWVTPELKQQSVAGTANGPDNGEDFVNSSAALSDTFVGSLR